MNIFILSFSLLKWMILQSFPILSHKTFKIQAGPRLDLIGPKGHDDFSDPLHPDRHVPIDLSHEETPRHPGVAGVFGQGKVRKKPGLDFRENCRRNLRLLFLKPRKAFRKNCLPNKCFPEKNKRCVQNKDKQSIFLWCHFYDYKISLQWLSTKQTFTTESKSWYHQQIWYLAHCKSWTTATNVYHKIVTTAAFYYRIHKFQLFVVSTSSPFS